MPEIINSVLFFPSVFDSNFGICWYLLNMTFLCLFSTVFRLYRCEPSVGPSNFAQQQLQELYAQVPQVRLHFPHGSGFPSFGLHCQHYLSSIYHLSLLKVTYLFCTRTFKHVYKDTDTGLDSKTHTLRYEGFSVLIHVSDHFQHQ